MIRPAAVFLASAALAAPALAQDSSEDGQSAAPDLRLYRLDCEPTEGEAVPDFTLNDFSDTQAYSDEPPQLTFSCYLVKHGEDWLLWDTGVPSAALEPQLEELDLAPGDIGSVGISHAHFDHVGNANMFADSTLIIQRAEYDAAFSETPPPAVRPELLSAFEDGQNVELVTGDYDIFGDGSVRTLSTPGHTPGHQALLVTLPEAGPVILSGDVAHFTENWETDGVPDFNTDRADTLASLDRLKRLAENLDARVIIQHEPDDIGKLPEFPDHLD